MTTIAKVLIANRGEIAVRLIRAATDLKIASVVIYAEADAAGLAPRLADEAFALTGDGVAAYLDVAQVLRIAQRCGADAVHPGYGFLAENADFARAVISAGLTWIGPPPSAIEALGDKVRARQIAREVGAPLAPASDGPIPDADAARAFAIDQGLPVVIKAVHGGGGRGMRVARDLDAVATQFEAASREAAAAFGRPECYLERYLERPRHIETQCLADRFGDVVVISTRDCSVQRRHQKLIEEAPAPFLSPDQHSRVVAASKAILRAVNYQGAGTVEFLLGADGTLSFLEVNTRLQVEHPVSEQVTGIDLVTEMFRLAAGEPLGYPDPTPHGHAIEFRINAEDAARGFVPDPGTITTWEPPAGPGVRLDEGYREHMTVPPQFDSLIAKLIVTGTDRQHALDRARRALGEFRVAGLATLVEFHRRLIEHPTFAARDQPWAVHTEWVEETFLPQADLIPAHPQTGGAGSEQTGRAGSEREAVVVEVAGRRVEVLIPAPPTRQVPRRSGASSVHRAHPGAPPEGVTATMPGTVISVAVHEGDVVCAGAELMVVEAMKMEQPVVAPHAGRVADLRVCPGQQVSAGQALCRITATHDGLPDQGPSIRS